MRTSNPRIRGRLFPIRIPLAWLFLTIDWVAVPYYLCKEQSGLCTSFLSVTCETPVDLDARTICRLVRPAWKGITERSGPDGNFTYWPSRVAAEANLYFRVSTRIDSSVLSWRRPIGVGKISAHGSERFVGQQGGTDHFACFPAGGEGARST